MRTVWKFPIPLIDGEGMVSAQPTIDMPHGAEVIHLDLQDGHPTLWAQVVDTQTKRPRRFRIVGTGEEIPHTCGRHVGSWQSGYFVFHLFEDAE